MDEQLMRSLGLDSASTKYKYIQTKDKPTSNMDMFNIQDINFLFTKIMYIGQKRHSLVQTSSFILVALCLPLLCLLRSPLV